MTIPQGAKQEQDDKARARALILSSLSAIGAHQEAKFYADLFAAQQPERFALLVIDSRCLLPPLDESLLSNLKILANLGLTPILLLRNSHPSSASYENKSYSGSQNNRLIEHLNTAKIAAKYIHLSSLNLAESIKEAAMTGNIVVTEDQDQDNDSLQGLLRLALDLKPNKILFLQPSGGLNYQGERVKNMTFDEITPHQTHMGLSHGQRVFLDHVRLLDQKLNHRCAYIIASPLNLLAELFTTKGSGTYIRRKIPVTIFRDLTQCDQARLKISMEAGFGKMLKPEFLRANFLRAYIAQDYQGGAIFMQHNRLTYLSKFWVTPEAQGAGIARDIWQALCADLPEFFWRSRQGNPFNDWYVKACDGMQNHGDWRIFWKGLSADDIAFAIGEANALPVDFTS